MRFAGAVVVGVWILYVGERFRVETIIATMIAKGVFVAVTSTIVVAAAPRIGEMSAYFHIGEWRGIYDHKNTLGSVMAHTIYFSALYFCVVRRSAWTVAAILLAAFVLAKTGSRTAIGLAALSALFYPYFKLRQSQALGITVLITLLLLTTAIAAAVLNGESLFAQNGETIRIVGVPFFLTGRFQSWQLALDKFADTPLIGFGYDGFWGEGLPGSSLWIADKWSGQQDAHNGFIDVLLQTGIIGEMLFVFVIGFYGLRFVSYGIRFGGPLADFGLAVLVLFGATNLTESVATKATNIVQLLLTLVVVMHARRSRRSAVVATA